MALMDTDIKSFDLLLTDVASEDLKNEISGKFGKQYLSDAGTDERIVGDADGVVWGAHNRVFVTMVVNLRGKFKHVHFILDTGVPQTYLCEEALTKFGISTGNFVSSTSIGCKINGVNVSIHMSPLGGHFKDVNIVGSDFLSNANAKVDIDYENKTCRVSMRQTF